MSIDMYVSDSQIQASSFGNYCNNQVQGYQSLEKALNSFTLNAPFLKGKAYDSGKRYFSSVLIPLIKGAKLLVEESGSAVKKFPEEYISNVDSGDLREEDLEQKIQALETRIKNLRHLQQQIDQSDISDKAKDVQLQSNMRMTDILLKGKEKFEEQLHKLRDFHATSPQLFSEIAALQQAVDQGLAQTQTSWNAVTGTFVIPKDLSWAKTIIDAPYVKIAKKKYKDHLKKYPEDIDKLVTMVRYEMLHPEYVDTTDKFLSPLEFKDQLEIKYMIYTAESPYDILCLKYMDKFEIEDINKPGVFNSSKNTLIFNIKEDRMNSRGKYYTFFHEMGHAIDYYYAKENGIEGFFSDSFEYKGKTLTEYNYLDVGNNLSESMKEILEDSKYDELSVGEKQTIIKNVKDNLLNQNKLFNDLSSTEKQIQKDLIIEYEAKLDGADHNTVSDITGGVTNLTVQGSYGHSEGYWFDANDNLVRNPNKECFAGYFGREIVGEPEHSAGLDSINHYLPNSSQSMQQMIEEMGSNQ